MTRYFTDCRVWHPSQPLSQWEISIFTNAEYPRISNYDAQWL